MNNVNRIFTDELVSFRIEMIHINTNAKSLFQDFRLFFTPYFSVDKNLFEGMNKIEAILIDETEYNKLLNGGIYMHEVNILYDGKNIENEKSVFSSYEYVINGEHAWVFPKQSIICFYNTNGDYKIYAKKYQKLYHFMRRFIRSEILYKKIIEQGFLPLHAACVTKNKKAIIFVGDSGVGKTSAMLPLIEYFGYDLVSSDLAFVSNEGDVLGTPEKVRICPKTIEQYSPKYDFILQSNEKQVLSPRYFSLVFNCRIIDRASLNILIFPKIDLCLKKSYIEKNRSDIEWKKFISPFFDENLCFSDFVWNKGVYNLYFSGKVDELVEVYRSMEKSTNLEFC